MTMRSPRMTLRLMSRSTWKSPYHLCMPTISTAVAVLETFIADGVDASSGGFAIAMI
jgi:hypothetical protein